MSSTAVIMNTHRQCERGGCQYSVACDLFKDAEQIQSQMSTAIKGSRMGIALWCDEGNHAFSEKADNMTGTRRVTRNGTTTVEDYLICADCMSRKTGIPAIENVPTQTDKVPGEDNGW